MLLSKNASLKIEGIKTIASNVIATSRKQEFNAENEPVLYDFDIFWNTPDYDYYTVFLEVSTEDPMARSKGFGFLVMLEGYFKIENESPELDGEKLLKVPFIIAESAVSIMIALARSQLMQAMANTIYNDYILPCVDYPDLLYRKFSQLNISVANKKSYTTAKRKKTPAIKPSESDSDLPF